MGATRDYRRHRKSEVLLQKSDYVGRLNLRVAHPSAAARGTHWILRMAYHSVLEDCGFRRSVGQPSRGTPASVPGRHCVATPVEIIAHHSRHSVGRRPLTNPFVPATHSGGKTTAAISVIFQHLTECDDGRELATHYAV
jgi:hypothetical protein